MKGRSIVTYVILSMAAIFALYPMVWALSSSFKMTGDIAIYPPQWIPRSPTLENYYLVLFKSWMPRYFLNSLLVGFSTIGLTLVISTLGAYAGSRFHFRGKNFILFVLLSTIMLPGIGILVPLYLNFVKMGLHDTYWALILIYSARQTPFVLWLLKGFFDGIPRDLDDAAHLDGCSSFGVLWRIIVPLASPGYGAAVLVIFLYVWCEFIIAMTMTSSSEMRLITVGLHFFVKAYGVEWGQMMATVTVALLPVIVLFVLLQKRFVQGLTAGALKG